MSLYFPDIIIEGSGMSGREENLSGLKSITVHGGKATYAESGKGVSIVAVHGVHGSYRVWRAMEPELTADFRVLSVNLPGIEGTSFKAGQGYSQKHVARFLSNFAKAMGLEKYFLMAHSWAGAASIHLAARQNNILGLVLFATVGPRIHKGWKTTPRPSTVSKLLLIPGMKKALRKPISRTFHNIGVSESAPYHELVHATHYSGHLDFRQIDLDLKRLRQPTFLVWSEDDRVVDSDIFNEMAAKCPEGPRIKFSTGGHMPQKTRAHEVGEQLRPWLSRICGQEA